MFQHFQSREEFNQKLNLYGLVDIFLDNRTVDQMNSVVKNCKISNSCNNWTILKDLEIYYIKMKLPVINLGLKTSKELQLFKRLIVFQLFK